MWTLGKDREEKGAVGGEQEATKIKGKEEHANGWGACQLQADIAGASRGISRWQH